MSAQSTGFTYLEKAIDKVPVLEPFFAGFTDRRRWGSVICTMFGVNLRDTGQKGSFQSLPIEKLGTWYGANLDSMKS